jgi:hypothetical protein
MTGEALGRTVSSASHRPHELHNLIQPFPNTPCAKTFIAQPDAFRACNNGTVGSLPPWESGRTKALWQGQLIVGNNNERVMAYQHQTSSENA